MARHRGSVAPAPAGRPVRADDALKYVLALFEERTEWAHSASCDDDHDFAYLDDVICIVEELVVRFGDQSRYSDGRRLKSTARIVDDLYVEHLWHPDPTEEKASTWRGELSSDPVAPWPAYYEVATDPMSQTIDVTVVESK